MQTKIVAFAAKKGGGKDSSARFLLEYLLYGQLSAGYERCLYSFAGKLKQLCIELGFCTYEQCYGTNDQKNSCTQVKWEDLPHYQLIKNEVKEFNWKSGYYTYDERNEQCLTDEGWKKVKKAPTGLMTARQVLQEVGTGIFRRMKPMVWIDYLIKSIQESGHSYAFITDARFPDECDAVKEAGGKVIRLLRNPYPDDNHASETALDDYRRFDAVIDNRYMTENERNNELARLVQDWGWYVA